MLWYCAVCSKQLGESGNAVQLHILQSPGCRDAVFMADPIPTISNVRSGRQLNPWTPARPESTANRQLLTGDIQAIDCYFALNQIGVFTRRMRYPLGRNILTVGAPTAVREAMRRGPLATLSTAAPHTALGLGVSACVLPIINQIIGLVRDRRNDSQTTFSVLSRVILILAVGCTCVTALGLGTLVTASPALIASTVFYTPLRDTAQYFLQLRGGYENGISQNATGLAAAAYFLNQLVMSFGMDAVAKALQPALGVIVSHIIGFSVLNIIGESIDDMISRYFNAIATSGTAPRLSLGLRRRADMNLTTVADQVFNANASRSSLLASAYNVAYYVKDDAWSNFGAAGTLALAYVPFINAASQATSTSVDVNAMENGQSSLASTSVPPSPSPSPSVYSVSVVNETINNTNKRKRLTNMNRQQMQQVIQKSPQSSFLKDIEIITRV